MTALEIAATFEDFENSHTPDGWPAVKQMQLTEAAAMLRKQDAAIKTLREALVYASTSVQEEESDRGRPCLAGQIIRQALAATEEFK